VLATGTDDVLVVQREGAPLIGISGHQLAALPISAKVWTHGERGPYKIVAWRGRTGYVLSDYLCSERELDAAEAEAAAAVIEEVPATSTAWRWAALILGSAVASAAGALYVFLIG
jgi:hypothetical protein